MRNLSDLRVPPPDPYAFKSRLKRRLMGLLDGAGRLLSAGPSRPIDWDSIRKIAVLRLDHLGDVLMAFPCLAALEKLLPRAQVDFYVGSWAREMAVLSGLRAGVRVFSAPWFDRGGQHVWSWKAVRELAGILRGGGYDAVLDLRGDFRHLLAMKRSGVPVRIGQTLTGGGFLLTHPAVFRDGLHETERNLDLLVQAGLPAGGESPLPRLEVRDEDEAQAGSVRKSLGLSGPWIALHATCASSAKRWPEENWRRLVEGLPGGLPVVAVGSRGEAADAERIFRGCGRKVVSAMGALSLGGLTAFLKDCRVFIGVDSAPAHVAAAVGTPVVSLFSGTNGARQWSPRGPKVLVLQERTECSPCERMECPFENECMRRIEVGEVAEAVKRLL